MHLMLATAILWIPLVNSVLGDPTSNTEYNVRDYNAVGDGRTLDSPAINKAIDACAAAGGGTVVFPAGTYLSGSIHLKSNIHLFLDAGSVILGAPQEMKAYDPAEPVDPNGFQDGGHSFFHNSLIWGENLVNVSITGPGMINGGGLVSSSDLLDEWCGFSKSSQNASINESSGTDEDQDVRRIGNKSICLKLCRNVLIRDVTISHGGHFAILVTGCNGMTIDNVTIDTERDGLDIDCCQNTAVSDCRINAPNDDALCPKSTYALGRSVITENLTISNCQVSGFDEGTLLDGTMKPSNDKNGRIKFGTEGTGGFRNCTVTNCTFRNCRGLALEEVDRGIMENIVISNLSMMDVSSYPIYLTTGSRNRGPATTSPSMMKNILITNVVANVDDSMSGIQITGIPAQPIEGVRLDNIRIIFKGGGTADDARRVPRELGADYPEPGTIGVMPAYGVFARHVKDLQLANVQVSFESDDLRPAISCIDVDGLDIDNFKATLASDVSAANFESVKNLTIRNSPEIPEQGQ
jgi:polygalacturonase